MIEAFGPFTVTIGAYPDTSATVNTPKVSGDISAIGIAVHSHTGDFTITTKGNTYTPSQTLLEVTSLGTDTWYYPRAAVQDTDGVDIAASYDEIPVADNLVILVENASAGDVFDVTFLIG
jgi:hypothetical protein